MTDIITFTDATPRFALPMLRPGQSQKEFFVNHAFALADMLLHCSVIGEVAAPPPSPADGDCWLVAQGASGEWSGHDGAIAGWQAGRWVYTPAQDGMRIHDRSTGQILLFSQAWERPQAPGMPIGGATIDIEMRAAFGHLLAALATAGIFPVTQ